MAGVDPAGSSRIFISYRREDSSGHVLALLPSLRSHFGADRIFKDTDNIPPGADFLKFIKNELESCSVLLAIIGREWLNIQDPRAKQRRIDNPEDFLRVEVASALKNERIRVIPVLIERASMPAAQDLPADLTDLAFRNAIELSDGRWDSDVRLLIEAVEHAVVETTAKPQAPMRPGLMDLQKRRAREIASHLATAREAFEAGDFDGALWACDKALLLDPQLPDVLELMDRARKALDEQKISTWLEDARRALAQGDIGKASDLIDQALSVDRDSQPAMTLRGEMLELRRERERERERARTVQAATERARASFEEEDFEGAVRHADDALAGESGYLDALTLKSKALAALEERRRQRDLKRRAQQTVTDARAKFAAGQHQDAVRLLREFTPGHELVSQALRELDDEAGAIQRKVAADEARREELRRAEEETQRAAAERALAERKAREDKEREEKARQERERQEKERQEKERQEKARQEKERQERALQEKERREREQHEKETRRLAEQRAAEEQRRREEQQRKEEQQRQEEQQRKEEEGRRNEQEAAQASRAAAAAPAPDATDENVQFTVFRRSAIQPEQWYPLLVFAHLADRRPDAPPDQPDPIEEVQAQARQILGDDMGDFRSATEDSGYPVARDGELRFVPHMEGVTFNPPERRFLWTESVHREDFRLRADKSMDGHVARGAVSVFYGNLLLAEVQLSIKVDRTSVETHHEETHARPYRRIFASYSHRDTAIVEEFESHAVATGDRYLRDVVTLRAGEVWDQRLLEIIKQADVFQLFWSWNALSSPLVREEWRQALALNRPHFVRPVYWEEPLPERAGLPPVELRRLHFQRVYPQVASPAMPSSAVPSALPSPSLERTPLPSPAVEPRPKLQRAPISRLVSYGSAATVLVAAVGLYFTVLNGPRAGETPAPQAQVELPSTGQGSGGAMTTTPSVQLPVGANPPPAATANPPSNAAINQPSTGTAQQPPGAAAKPSPTVPLETPATATGRSGGAGRGSGGAAKPPVSVTPTPVPSEPTSSAPVTKTPVETPQVVVPKEPVVESPPPPVTVRPPAVEAVKPPIPDRLEEERRVRGALERYESAYDNLDAEAVRALYPGAPPNLAATFAQYQFYRLELVVQKVTLAPDFNSATAVARLSHFFQPKVGRGQQSVRTQEFTFEKRGNSWIIVRIR